MFTDDVAAVAESEQNLQQNIDILKDELQKVNMEINISKTKTMVISPKHKKHSISIDGQKVEQVERY